MTHQPAGSVLAALASQATGDSYWRLDQPGAGLDVEAMRIPPSAAAEPPGGGSREVLVIALDGDGRLRTPDRWLELAPRAAAWLPPAAGYRLHAGEAGMHCVTVRPRHPATPLTPTALGKSPQAGWHARHPCRGDVPSAPLDADLLVHSPSRREATLVR